MNKEIKSFLDERLKTNHFIQHMGLVLEDVNTGTAEMSINVEEHHLQQNGFLHGGVTATLCDVTTGIAAYTTVKKEKNVVTADLKVKLPQPKHLKNSKSGKQSAKSRQFLDLLRL